MDPSKLKDLLPLIKDRPEVMERAMEEFKKSQDNYMKSNDREFLISHHNQIRRDVEIHIEKQLNVIPTGVPSEFVLKKSGKAPVKSIGQCLPIDLCGMTLNNTHRGRVLYGKLVVEPMVMTALQTILEDKNGDLVRTSIYHPPIDDFPLWRKMKIAETRFPKGSKIAIIEPFIKQAMDGSIIIRVDNIDEVIFVDEIVSLDAEELKAQGNSHFQQKQYSDAVDCYNQSMNALEGRDECCAILQNISLMYYKLEHYEAALLYATASVHISPDFKNQKASERAKMAIQGLWKNGIAFTPYSPKNKLQNPDVQLFIAQSDIYTTQAIGSITGTVSEAMDLKKSGNQLFQNGEISGALDLYLKAIAVFDASCSHFLSTILSNRAACYQNLEEHLQAAVDAALSITIRPEGLKAHYRRAQSLLQIDSPQASLKACEIALELFPANAEIEKLKERAKRVLAVQNISISPPICHITEKQIEKQKNANVASVEQLEMANSMLQLAKATSPNENIEHANPVDDRVASFHTQFFTQGYWPDQCDIDACQRYLWSCYEHARSNIKEDLILFGKSDIFDKNDLSKRVGPPTEETLRWYAQQTHKSVHFRGTRYDDRIVHSFGNCPPCKIQIKRNTTHVAIGFADLGELSIAKIIGKKGAVRWIGYDQSAYTVAKTLAIISMIQGNAHIDDILQIWYSSAWSYRALQSFRDALARIDLSAQPSEVQALIVYWEQHDVSLGRSRQEWLDSHSNPNSVVANFVDSHHQLAYCQYMICGQLLPTDVGSITMYAIPNNLGTLSLGENIFETLTLHEVMGRAGKKKDIIQAAIETLRNQIQTLKERIRSQKIFVEVHVGVMNPKSPIIDEIANLRPKTLSWSNVVDYFLPEEFGQMITSINRNGGETHYMYSMNWPYSVFGTFTMDIQDLDERKAILANSKTRLQQQYEKLGYTNYLHFPPIGNPVNMMDWMLQSDLYSMWMGEFCSASGIPITCANTTSRIFDVTNRNISTIDMVFNF